MLVTIYHVYCHATSLANGHNYGHETFTIYGQWIWLHATQLANDHGVREED